MQLLRCLFLLFCLFSVDLTTLFPTFNVSGSFYNVEEDLWKLSNGVLRLVGNINKLVNDFACELFWLCLWELLHKNIVLSGVSWFFFVYRAVSCIFPTTEGFNAFSLTQGIIQIIVADYNHKIIINELHNMKLLIENYCELCLLLLFVVSTLATLSHADINAPYALFSYSFIASNRHRNPIK